jgi:predicted transposase YdaD
MRHGLEILLDEQRQKWKEEGILQTARAMQAKGFDTGTIAEVTGLSVDDILKMQHNA